MGYMTLEVETPNLYIELTGPNAKAWPIGGGLPCYEGPIEGLPEEDLRYLIERGYVRETQ